MLSDTGVLDEQQPDTDPLQADCAEGRIKSPFSQTRSTRSRLVQPIGGSANGMKAARRADDIRVLGEIKRDNKKKLDNQRNAYMQLLDYFLDKAKLQNKKFKEYRVTEVERRIFDALKIISEGNWIIHTADEFKLILNEIGVEWPLRNLPDQSPTRAVQVAQVTQLVEKLYELLGLHNK